jgi:hypothetical protein
LELLALVEPPLLGGVRVPRLVAASDALLVLERMPGQPLAPRRHDSRIERIEPSTWAALLLAREALRRWSPVGLTLPPPGGPATALMRRRMLEDPSAPVAWIAEGIGCLHSAGLLDDREAETMCRALASHPATCFSHGDLLLRNVLREPSGGLALVDWECAGLHAEAWDAALLWVFAPSWARERLAADHSASGASRAAFLACVAFALTREMFYRRRRRPATQPDGSRWAGPLPRRRPRDAEDAVTRRLSGDRSSVLTELRDTST